MVNRIRYTVEKVLSSSFYQMPKFLFEGDCKGLSNDARILYTLLKDRHELSVKNQWYNDKKEVYLIMKREEMESMLNLTPFTVRKVLKELKDLNLVEEERKGLNKPNIIYLLECKNFTLQTVKKSRSETKIVDSQENKEITPNHTNHNKTEQNKTDSNNESIDSFRSAKNRNSDYPPTPQKNKNDTKETIDRDAIKEAVKYNIDLIGLQRKYPNHQGSLQELYEIIAEILVSRKEVFRISKEDMPAAEVKQAFASLGRDHVEYALHSLRRTTSSVRNTKAYIQTTLYNAAKTIDNYYSLEVQHDLYKTLGISPD